MDNEYTPNPQTPDSEQSSGQYYYDPEHLQQNGNYYQNSPVPPATQPPNGFAKAALILGIFSIVLSCCGYLSIILGALGILFAILSKGGEAKMPASAKPGFWLSLIGILVSIVLLAVMLFTALFIRPDTFKHQMRDYMEYYMGDDFNEEDFNRIFGEGPSSNHSYESPYDGL